MADKLEYWVDNNWKEFQPGMKIEDTPMIRVTERLTKEELFERYPYIEHFDFE